MKLIIFFTLFFYTGVWAAVEPETENKQPRLLVHLLEYIAADYPGAVQNGKVISESEYAEQKEFVQRAEDALETLPDLKKNKDLSAGLESLRSLVLKKGQAEDVSRSALKVKTLAIHLAHIDESPTRWPSLRRGHTLFQQNCAKCHGVNGFGDGHDGKNLNPPPANFHEAKMGSVPPFQAFNTIRLGVPGTGMAEFPFLSDRDVWDLAFYVTSFRYQEIETDADFEPTISLKEASVKSDDELRAQYGKVLSEIRLYEPKVDDSTKFLELARSNLVQAKESYAKNAMDKASQFALLAYLDGVEPVEPRLRSKDSKFVVELETKMLAARSAIDKKKSPENVGAEIDVALGALTQAQTILAQSESSPAITFSVAAGIFLREAFEAILLLITILGVLKSVGSKKAVFFVHLGWASALVAGLILWFSSGWLMQISGAQREMMEGLISVFAVAVLLYFGFWLHRKTEIGKWRNFLNEMLDSAMDGKSLAGLWGIAFMAVFREAFEVILFLRALLLEAQGQQMAVASGVFSSLIVVVILAWALLKFSARLPIRQLFAVSSLMMAVLAFILVGKAAHSFQEINWLPITQLPYDLRFDLVGLYPTWETVVPQIAVLILTLCLWVIGRRPLRQHQAA